MKIPKQVNIEVSGICNLRCKYCPTLSPDANKGLMDFDFFKTIIDRINFPTVVVPLQNGEPLLHPQYAEMLKYIEQANLKYYVTTNGTIWNNDVFNVMLNSENCYQLIFSLDGLPIDKSRSIELARPGTDRKQVLNTINRFMELKKQKKSNIKIAIKLCQRGQDFEEIENFIAYWLKKGVNYVCIGKALTNDDNDQMRLYPCQYSVDKFMVIKWDGRLVPCAYNWAAANKRLINLGFVDKTTPLLDIYNNKLYKKFRKTNSFPYFTKPCDTCGFAYTGTGFRGMIQFRDKILCDKDIYYQQDYYNEFFSFQKDWKPDKYYIER